MRRERTSVPMGGNRLLGLPRLGVRGVRAGIRHLDDDAFLLRIENANSCILNLFGRALLNHPRREIDIGNSNVNPESTFAVERDIRNVCRRLTEGEI